MLKKILFGLCLLILSQTGFAVDLENRPDTFVIKGGVNVSSAATSLPGTIRYQSGIFEGNFNGSWIAISTAVVDPNKVPYTGADRYVDLGDWGISGSSAAFNVIHVSSIVGKSPIYVENNMIVSGCDSEANLFKIGTSTSNYTGFGSYDMGTGSVSDNLIFSHDNDGLGAFIVVGAEDKPTVPTITYVGGNFNGPSNPEFQILAWDNNIQENTNMILQQNYGPVSYLNGANLLLVNYTTSASTAAPGIAYIARGGIGGDGAKHVFIGGANNSAYFYDNTIEMIAGDGTGNSDLPLTVYGEYGVGTTFNSSGTITFLPEIFGSTMTLNVLIVSTINAPTATDLRITYDPGYNVHFGLDYPSELPSNIFETFDGVTIVSSDVWNGFVSINAGLGSSLSGTNYGDKTTWQATKPAIESVRIATIGGLGTNVGLHQIWKDMNSSLTEISAAKIFSNSAENPGAVFEVYGSELTDTSTGTIRIINTSNRPAIEAMDSTKVCPLLNADLLDSQTATDFVAVIGDTMTGTLNGTNISLTYGISAGTGNIAGALEAGSLLTGDGSGNTITIDWGDPFGAGVIPYIAVSNGNPLFLGSDDKEPGFVAFRNNAGTVESEPILGGYAWDTNGYVGGNIGLFVLQGSYTDGITLEMNTISGTPNTDINLNGQVHTSTITTTTGGNGILYLQPDTYTTFGNSLNVPSNIAVLETQVAAGQGIMGMVDASAGVPFLMMNKAANFSGIFGNWGDRKETEVTRVPLAIVRVAETGTTALENQGPLLTGFAQSGDLSTFGLSFVLYTNTEDQNTGIMQLYGSNLNDRSEGLLEVLNSTTRPAITASDYTKVCTNVNADLLDGQHGSYYLSGSSATLNYVNITGDTMSGNLVVPEIEVSTIGAPTGENMRITKDSDKFFHFGNALPTELIGIVDYDTLFCSTDTKTGLAVANGGTGKSGSLINYGNRTGWQTGAVNEVLRFPTLGGSGENVGLLSQWKSLSSVGATTLSAKIYSNDVLNPGAIMEIYGSELPASSTGTLRIINTAIRPAIEATDSTKVCPLLNVDLLDGYDSSDFYILGTSTKEWTVSNVSTDTVFDTDLTTINELADILGTLIQELKNINVLKE